MRALPPSAVGFDLKLQLSPKNVSVTTPQPAPEVVQPVSGIMQLGGKLSLSASLMLTTPLAANPPGTPIETPLVGPSSATLNVFGPSGTPSCRIGTVINLLPPSPLAHEITPVLTV